MREAGRKQMIIGLAIAGVGLVLSLGTYAAASPGGGYFIFWGVVVLGLIRAGRGFSMMSKAGSSPSIQHAQPSNTLQRIQVESSTTEMPPPPPSPPSSPPSTSMWD